MCDLNRECENRFDRIDNQLNLVRTEFSSFKTAIKDLGSSYTEIHKKLFVSNGQRAMVELVRDNRNEISRLQEVFKADNKPEKNSKISIGFKGIIGENVPVVDLIKLGVAVVACIIGFFMLVKMFHLQETVSSVRKAQQTTIEKLHE